MNNTLKTYKEIFQDYAQRNNMNSDIERMLKKFILLIHGKNILDVGCAQGRESAYFSNAGFNIIGIDITEEFIALAEANCPLGTFRVMDMTNLEFDNDSFNGIWACASFLHIPKTSALKTLLGFNKVLTSKGLLYLSVMEGDFDGERINQNLNWGLRHFADYSSDELGNLIKEAGFLIENSEKVLTPSGKTFIHIFARKI